MTEDKKTKVVSMGPQLYEVDFTVGDIVFDKVFGEIYEILDFHLAETRDFYIEHYYNDSMPEKNETFWMASVKELTDRASYAGRIRLTLDNLEKAPKHVEHLYRRK